MPSITAGSRKPARDQDGPLLRVDTALQLSTPPMPWSGRRTKDVVSFRGRVGPGWAQLPVTPLAEIDQGVTFGLASAPVILKRLGRSHPVPANTPWAVPSDGTWRLVFTRTVDLRLIHGNGSVVNAPPSARRPLRFQGTCERAIRAAINAATPVWIDQRCRPIANLASLQPSHLRTTPSPVRPLGPLVDHDSTAAFVMLATWAFEQHGKAADPRLDRVIEHIDARLADPGLSTDTIAAGCGVSRRTLQTLFADHGGIAGYLRRRRLTAALGILADGDQVPDLDDVAQAAGLGSRRTLERAVRQVYGLTPRQARAQILAGVPLRELEGRNLRAS